jgi:membrane protease YdiL (CAAX protease family)
MNGDPSIGMLHPAAQWLVGTLFLVGLVVDGFLLVRFFQSDTRRAALWNVPTKPWGVRDLIMGVAVFALVFIVAALAFQAALMFFQVRRPWKPSILISIEMLTRVAVLLALLQFLRERRVNLRDGLGFSDGNAANAVGAAAILFVGALPPVFLTYVAYTKLLELAGVPIEPQEITTLLRGADSPWLVALVIGFAVIVAPIFEEILFRGFAYPALKQKFGTWAALALVSLAFAALHMNISVALPLFVLSIGLGLAYEFTGSLLAPITMHALFNALSSVLLMSTQFS